MSGFRACERMTSTPNSCRSINPQPPRNASEQVYQVLVDLVRNQRVALVVLWLIATWATAAFAQAPTVLECNEETDLTSTAQFDPPVRDPLTYEWRDSTGRVVGSEDGLTVALPVGQYIYTVVVTAENGRTATTRSTVLVRDTTRPSVRVSTDLVEAPANVVSADDVRRAAGFTATDRCDSRPIVTLSPTGPYPQGDTRVLLTATDVSGNSASVAVVMRVPRPATPPRLGGAPAGRGASPGTPLGGIATPGTLPPGRAQQGRSGGSSPSSSAPSVPPAPGVPNEPPVPATPFEPVVPGAPPDPTRGSVPGANAPVQAPPAANEPPQAPPAAAPGAAPVSVAPGAASSGASGSTDVVGVSWWWLIVPGGLLLAGLLLFARRDRDRVLPPLRATVRTLPHKDLGVQRLLLPPGVAQPRFAIRLRPRLDSTPQLVVSDSSIVEERRTHA